MIVFTSEFHHKAPDQIEPIMLIGMYAAEKRINIICQNIIFKYMCSDYYLNHRLSTNLWRLIQYQKQILALLRLTY